MSIRVLVVDDEGPARQVIREMLADSEDYEVVAESSDGFAAVKAVAEHRPDIVLLDIQMPKLNGFEVLELLEPGPQVIFVTAYDQFALRAFEVNAVDYLLKPFDKPRLLRALNRARERLGSPAGVEPAVLASSARGGERLERIVIQDRGQIHVLQVDEINYVEAQGDYVALHAAGESLLKQQTLKSLGESLDPRRFVRVHRSYIVNLDRLERIEPMGKDSRVAVLTSGEEIPVSRSGYRKIRGIIS